MRASYARQLVVAEVVNLSSYAVFLINHYSGLRPVDLPVNTIHFGKLPDRSCKDWFLAIDVSMYFQKYPPFIRSRQQDGLVDNYTLVTHGQPAIEVLGIVGVQPNTAATLEVVDAQGRVRSMNAKRRKAQSDPVPA